MDDPKISNVIRESVDSLIKGGEGVGSLVFMNDPGVSGATRESTDTLTRGCRKSGILG